jgi:hypothetical protein
MALMYLSQLQDHLQAEVLKNHPDFHSYGMQQQIDALRKTKHNASKRSNKEVKQENQIKAAVETIRAKREEAKAVEAPQKADAAPTVAPTSAPQPRAPRQPAAESATDIPISQIITGFQKSRFALSKEEEIPDATPNIHHSAMVDIAGQMLDHLDSNPEAHSNDIRNHLDKFQDSIGLHAYSHDLAERTGWRNSMAGNAAKQHLKEAHQHLSAAANIFHNRFKDFSSNGVSLGEQSSVIANDYIAEHAGTVRSKESKIDTSEMSQEQLRQGLITGKFKDESSDEGSRKFTARMRSATFWADQDKIRAARAASEADENLKEINKSDTKQKKDPSNPLKDVKARRGDDGTRIITEALGKRRLRVQKILGTNVAPVSSDLPGRVRGKFEPEPVAPVAPVKPRVVAPIDPKQANKAKGKRRAVRIASRRAELVQHSSIALKSLTAGFSVPKDSEAVIAKKPGLMEALNKEATKRQISRAGHTAAFDAARGAEVPDKEA